MQGKVVDRALVIMDSFALPVQGTETRVNAANEANEYMVQYISDGEKVSRLEHAIGWYHSHPGYGCWLSGIDVNTQLTNQKYQDPFVAVVVRRPRFFFGLANLFPDRPEPYHLGWQSRHWSVPHVS